MGTPDWWLVLHGVGEMDSDSHGWFAWQDYVADMDPANPASVFGIVAVSNYPPANVVSFLSSSNRLYELVSTTNLLTGAWTNLSGLPNLRGIGGIMSLGDTNPAVERFYRVRVHVP